MHRASLSLLSHGALPPQASSDREGQTLLVACSAANSVSPSLRICQVFCLFVSFLRYLCMCVGHDAGTGGSGRLTCAKQMPCCGVPPSTPNTLHFQAVLSRSTFRPPSRDSRAVKSHSPLLTKSKLVTLEPGSLSDFSAKSG